MLTEQSFGKCVGRYCKIIYMLSESCIPQSVLATFATCTFLLGDW
jgi:hypothetical protein